MSTTRDAPAVAASRQHGEPAPARAWPPVWLMGVHIAALWTLAFVQPLFDLLGKNAAFFVARDNTPGDILILALGFTFGPPLAATAALAAVAAVSRRGARVLHLAVLAFLAAVLVLQVIKGLSGSAAVLFPIALAIGAALSAAYARSGGLRSFVSVLGVAPVVVVALLLVFSPVSDLVFGGEEGNTQAAAKVASGAAPTTPVVVMLFDELPTTSLMTADGRVDRERFPNFAELADASTWYQNATSVSDGTYVAVPAIFTGLRPQAELPTSREYPRNLFTLLGRSHEVHASEPITHVCPEELCDTSATAQSQRTRLKNLARDLRIVEGRLLLPDDLADDLPAIDRDWEDFAAEAGEDGLAEAAEEESLPRNAGSTGPDDPLRVAGSDLPSQRVRAGRSVVRTMRPGRKPGLWMVHYVIPHVPWRFLPDGSQYVVEGPSMPGLDDQDWGRNQELLNLAWQRHWLMMEFADRLMGDAIDQMKRTGLWDDALVIVVSDHGGSIWPGGSRRPVTEENFAEVAGVPLFVKLPGQEEGRVDPAFTTTMDILPTVVDVLGIRNDWTFDGRPVDEPRDPDLLQQRNGRTAKLVGVTPERFLALRERYLARQLELFPSGRDAIWRAGPRDDVLGRSVAELTGGAQAAGEPSGRIDNARLYRRVRPRSGVIPAYVTGTVEGLASGTQVAVAVNGTIEGTGELYDDDGNARFSVLVPPETLRKGANLVEVYSLADRPARMVATTG